MSAQPVTFPRHWPAVGDSESGWSVNEGRLQLDGRPVDDWIAGRRTPLYLYSRHVIEAQVRRVRDILPAGCELHYALKANPHPPLVQYLRGLVDGADVASAGEMQLALAAGFAAQHIGFAGPGKQASEIDQARQAGVTVTAESMRQIEAVAAAGARSVALRINAGQQMRASGMRMAGGASAFGIDSEQVGQAVALARGLGLQVSGLHLYAGSQNLEAGQIAENIRQAADTACQVAPALGEGSLHWVNVGGGLGVPYFPGEKALELEPIAGALQQAAQQVAALGARLRIELGRYLVAEAGVYLTRIIDEKWSRGRHYLILDGGLHHHQAACGNFGQVIKRPFPIALSRSSGRPAARTPRRENHDLVGPLCTPMDSFARDLELEDAQPGDLMAIFRSGAYGASASPQAFLGHEPAGEWLV